MFPSSASWRGTKKQQQTKKNKKKKKKKKKKKVYQAKLDKSKLLVLSV